MLYTNLKHLENSAEHDQAIHENQYVIIICGRMDHRCIPFFRIMEELEPSFTHVKFYDMDYDNPESQVIRSRFAQINSSETPLLICYKNGEIVHTASAVHSKEEIIRLLEQELTSCASI